jgi:hypothetical protein
MDDMSQLSSPSLPNRMGVYFWIPKDEWYFKSSMERVADGEEIGYVSFIQTHNEKCYHPVGVSFGSDASKKPFFIDMSGTGGDSVMIEVENRHSEALRVRVTLKDDAENMIDTKAGTPVASPWVGAMEFDVEPGALATRTFSYKGGYYAEWGNASKCNLLQATPTKLPCGIQKTNMARIAGANITINSVTPDVSGLTEAELRIRAMAFGKVPAALGTSNRQKMSKYPSGLRAVKRGLVPFPSPDGRLFDAHGRLMPVKPAH